MTPEGFEGKSGGISSWLGSPCIHPQAVGKALCEGVWGTVMDKTDVTPALMGPLNWGWGRGKEYQIYRIVCD